MVLCYDLLWGQFYLYGGSNTIYLDPHLFTNSFKIGQRVRITGRTAWDGTAAVLTNTSAAILGKTQLPNPVTLPISEMSQFGGQWIETTGLVRVAETSRGRVTLVLWDQGRECVVYVLQTSGADRFRQFCDSEVRVRGINASPIENGRVEQAIVFCPSPNDLMVIKAPPFDRWNLPVSSIDSVASRPLGDWTNQPVRLNGQVSSYEPGKTIVIKDATGGLSAQVNQVTPIAIHQRVDLWGFLTPSASGPLLVDGYFEAATGRVAAETPSPTSPISHQPALTSIREVRQLSREQANQHFPARLRGVLTYVDTDWHLAFLQDGRDAIFLEPSQGELRSGQFVEVTGQTDGSGFAPELIQCSAAVLGTTNLPTPVHAELSDAADGHLDSRWVEMQGVVHSAHWDNGRLNLKIAAADGSFSASVLDPNAQSGDGLVDALITIRGACSSVVNSRGQISGVLLQTPSRAQIDIMDEGPADPFSITPVPISKIATFDAGRLVGRRTLIEGVVTVVTPSHGFYVQDASGGIRVPQAFTNECRPGDRVKVTGFQGFSDGAPCLEEANVRVEGRAQLPPGKAASAAGILRDGAWDAQRVTLKAEVLQSHLRSALPKLVLQDGESIFTASIVDAGSQRPGSELAPGCTVQVEGVCAVQWGEIEGINEPETFRLLLSSHDHVKVLRAAPWWTLRHTLMLLGGIALGVILASVWVASLRRQVKSQTKVIQEKQRELLEVSRRAGMAEVATSVLHNVGNVLNSVNVAASVVTDTIKSSAADNLKRAVDLMKEHREDLGSFVMEHPRGRHLPVFLERLAEKWRNENESVLHELRALQKNIEHINGIVAMQQNFARVGGIVDEVSVTDVLEDAALINNASLERHGIVLRRQYPTQPVTLTLEKHKLLQILVNLIGNAKNACLESPSPVKEITLRAEQLDSKVVLTVSDTGVGISAENMGRIFSFGFTTRKDGHGFGLHSGALTARELGGSLTGRSEGPGKGAIFMLELPAAKTA